MDGGRDQEGLLGHSDEMGRAVASTGLWITLAGAVALLLIGVFGLIAGIKPAVWVAVVGGILSVGAGVLIRMRKR